MRVIAKKILREFWEKHPDSEDQLKTWFKEASKANWSDPKDIKNEYPKAGILKGGQGRRIKINIYLQTLNLLYNNCQKLEARSSKESLPFFVSYLIKI